MCGTLVKGAVAFAPQTNARLNQPHRHLHQRQHLPSVVISAVLMALGMISAIVVTVEVTVVAGTLAARFQASLHWVPSAQRDFLLQFESQKVSQAFFCV